MVIWHSVYTNSKPMIHISRFYRFNYVRRMMRTISVTF